MRATIGVILGGLVGLGLAAGAAQAAPITWGAATTISGDSDVSTNGTLVGAVNLGTPASVGFGVGVNTTVNGVLFTGLGIPLSGVATATSGPFSFATNVQSSNVSAGDPAPYSGLSAAYRALLDGAAVDNPTIPTSLRSLTITGLVTGRSYAFQFWVHRSSLSSRPVIATAGNSVTVLGNTTTAFGGLGQFAIGTFVADADSQVIAFAPGSPGGQISINAVQLRDITPAAAVPAPATLALLGLGLLALGYARRA